MEEAGLNLAEAELVGLVNPADAEAEGEGRL